MTDDERVYVAVGCDRYHELRQCQGLSHARAVDERPLSSLPDEYAVCRLCSGPSEPDSSGGSPVTARILEDLDPEDVGSRLPCGNVD